MPGKLRKCLRDKTLQNVLTSHLSETDKHCISEVFVAYEHLLDKERTKQGQWIDQIALKKCSLCRVHQIEISPYCPNCGAKMEVNDE